MFQLDNIRKHVTEKLDEITVFREFYNNTISIKETGNDDDNDLSRVILDEVNIFNIPNDNVWIFENEFGHIAFTGTLQSQKGAFMSGGKKVEKTILFHHSNKLYIVMFEMKRTISPAKMQEDVIKKFESSLSTLSVYISSHINIPNIKNTKIFPIGVCCYNYYEDNNTNKNNDPRRITGRVRKKYNSGQRLFNLKVEPLSLNTMEIPVFFIQNPNTDPVTTFFDIDFKQIIDKFK